MVRQDEAFVSQIRPIWTFKDVTYSNECPPRAYAMSEEMLELVHFKVSTDSDAAASRLMLAQDENGNCVRTEMRWAWLRVDKTTGAGWVRVDHLYSPIVYDGNWEQWLETHDSELIFTYWSTWVPLPDFVATYPRFQRQPSIEVRDAYPLSMDTGPFWRMPWWKDSPNKDEPEVVPGMSEEDEAALLGDSCEFDKGIWFRRVKQGDPGRVLDGQAAYNWWWKFFG